MHLAPEKVGGIGGSMALTVIQGGVSIMHVAFDVLVCVVLAVEGSH